MNDLETTTAALKASGRKALVAFLTAGYPDDATFEDLVRASADAGCDVIEIGIPFSDPIADGPIIQAASNVALARGVTLRSALAQCARLSARFSARVPLVFMSYINPILTMGVETFADEARASGLSGLILPDVSFEESGAFRPVLRARGLAYIDLVAPTSDDARLSAIAGASSGFVYLVSVTGVTGARTAHPMGVTELADRVRAATETPVYVGFGVSTPEHAASVAHAADGVIIGSRLIQLAGDGHPAQAGKRVGEFLTAARKAIDAGSDEQRQLIHVSMPRQ
jgi:tryptophan synthase alpha chain